MFGKNKKVFDEKIENALEGELLMSEDILQNEAEAERETASKEGKKTRKKNKDKKEKKVLFSIRLKVALIMVVAVVVAVGVNYVYLTSMTEEALIENTESSLVNVASAHIGTIDQAIMKYISTMTYLDNSENITIFEVNKGEKFENEVNATLDKFLEKNSELASISFVGQELKTVLASTDDAQVGKDCADVAFINYILENNVPAQSDVFIDEATGEPFISIGVPQVKYKDTRLSGVMYVNINAGLLSDAVAGIKVNGQEASYACLLDTSGNYIYHPDVTKIGTKTTEPVLLDLVTRVQADEEIAPSVTLDENGNYVAYSVSSVNNWILPIYIPRSDVLAPVTAMSTSALSISAVLIILLSVIAFMFAISITAPLKKITHVVRKIADLDLAQHKKYAYLAKKHDETGEIGRAVEKMRVAFGDMMGELSDISTSISQDADHLNEIANVVSDHADNNFATTQQLSASMEETSASTDVISSDVSKIESYTSEINARATEGVRLSEEIMKRTVEMKANTLEASESTRQMYETVRKETQNAIERSKSVEKIDELANAIKEIADQTGLLSLNASIEAARAGEAGRGFSVVASEIGKLADQSSQTVGSITSIVQEVTFAVNDMTQSLAKTLDFLENKVLGDYDGFILSCEKYASDATDINQTMQEVDRSIDELNDSMLKISDAITGINDAVAESTRGVADVVANNSDIVKLTRDTYEMAQETLRNAEVLDTIIGKFQLDKE